MSLSHEFLQPSFKTLSGRSMMEFAFMPEDVVSYQLEMIRHNKIPGLLSCDVLKVDGEIRLSLDITSLIPLKKLLERMELGRDQFIRLVKQIVSLLEGIQEYLLDTGGIVFDSRYVFVSPDDLKLSFAYLPMKDNPQHLEPLKKMLLDLIIGEIRFMDEVSDNYVQKLIELLKNNEFSIVRLRAYIQDMQTLREQNKISFQAGGSQSAGAVPQKNSPPVNTGQIINKNAAANACQIQKTVLTQSPKTAGNAQIRNETKMVYPLKSFIVLGATIASFLILGIALSFTETFSASNPDFLLSLFGYMMIGGALSYLVYTKLFTPDKKIEKTIVKPVSMPQGKPGTANFKDPMPHLSQLRKADPQPCEVPATGSEKKNADPLTLFTDAPPISRGIQYVNKSFSVPAGNFRDASEEAALADSSADTFKPYSQQSHESLPDRTMILDPGQIKSPVLKRQTGGAAETIMMPRFPFMIGRLKDQVDYWINNPAIGKMHAEIAKTPEGYFITDMNSRNGTMVNGERLEPNKPHKLGNGCRITLANEELIFSEPGVPSQAH